MELSLIVQIDADNRGAIIYAAEIKIENNKVVTEHEAFNVKG